ncbi:MAG: DUF433 domain-containing protein [Acidimicrobiia bacterium]|nr:DUF433 domain-containing protein [Acidimicrobiia bacterium]MYG73389.1 DUF433 domain-containing protein [Acidimicrobiia bacterium]
MMGDVALLDLEMYCRRDAARLLGIAPQTLGRWLDGYTAPNGCRHPAVLRIEPRASLVAGRRYVTWGEFIEAGHLAAYRQQQRMPLNKLREYASAWRGRSDVSYPLARCKLGATPGWCLNDDGVASAESVAAFFDRVDFEGDIAVRYWPDGRDAYIVVDPRRQFGTPIIEGTRMGTEVVHRMYTAGDPAEWLAPAYGLDLVQVEAAIRFEQRLANRNVTAYSAA